MWCMRLLACVRFCTWPPPPAAANRGSTHQQRGSRRSCRSGCTTQWQRSGLRHVSTTPFLPRSRVEHAARLCRPARAWLHPRAIQHRISCFQSCHVVVHVMAEATEMQSATRSRRVTRPPKRLYEDEGAVFASQTHESGFREAAACAHAHCCLRSVAPLSGLSSSPSLTTSPVFALRHAVSCA